VSQAARCSRAWARFLNLNLGLRFLVEFGFPLFFAKTVPTMRSTRSTNAFYAFYAWWIDFPQSGALAEGTSDDHGPVSHKHDQA
jgi:hypothetical protein